MEERYNVYFAGQVKDGADPASVREQLAKVFNANSATLDKLFCGDPQLIKRECDLATAQKYQAAMERAGAVPIIKRTAAASTSPPPSRAPAAEATRTMTAAERIAALAAAPDENRFKREQAASATATSTATAAPADTDGIVLAPPGTAVLRDEERAEPVIRTVDTSHLALDTTAERLSDEASPAPASPDTSHLSMGEVGDTIPNLPSSNAPLSPNLDGLELSAAGTDFSDCAAPEQETPALDLSALATLAPGTQTEEEQRRQPIPVAVPSTDHISIQE
ncbi:MAG: hypothetical protein R3E64_06340 [Halioglobus sp.]